MQMRTSLWVLGLLVLMLNMSMIPSFVAPRGREVSFSPSLTYSHTRTHARRLSHENYKASSISFGYLPRGGLLTYISALTGAICAGVWFDLCWDRGEKISAGKWFKRYFRVLSDVCSLHDIELLIWISCPSDETGFGSRHVVHWRAGRRDFKQSW